jgi:hypothetical protein
MRTARLESRGATQADKTFGATMRKSTSRPALDLCRDLVSDDHSNAGLLRPNSAAHYPTPRLGRMRLSRLSRLRSATAWE